MNYPTRCTHCISLLKNCTTTKGLHYYMLQGEMYVDLPTPSIQTLVTLLEHHQEETFFYYNQLLQAKL